MAQVQAIRCKCGNIFAGCRLPECYTEVDWMKEVRVEVKRGCTIEIVDAQSFSFEHCTCKKEVENKNQTTLAI